MNSLRMLLRSPVRYGSRHLRMARFFSGAKSDKLWGGRFAKDTDTRGVTWAESLTCDEEMVVEDLWGSIAHVSMLGHQGIVPPDQAAQIIATLSSFQDDFIAGKLDFFEERFAGHDDVHMNMEARLIDRLGMEIGGKMHTTRSRNDQVPVSSRLCGRNKTLELRRAAIEATKAFMNRATEEGADTAVMPGYTHFQHAQPISVAFWMTHYAYALHRDLRRLKSSYDTIDENPLGGGAISGTSFPTDRSITTDLLGFQTTQHHSLDATGNRDFLLETLSTVATMQSTFSRLAEELIMWSSYEFRTVTLDDGFAMGSSMMPQKKNPGPLELLRGRTGIINGYLMGALTMLHGLPSGYNRDFHEEKELLFAGLNMGIRATQIVNPLVETTTFNLERMADLCDKNFMTATELANYLVTDHDVPFRETHHIVGSLVGNLTRAGSDLTNIPAVMEHLASEGIENADEEAVRRVLDPKSVMMTYNSYGGTGPAAVADIVTDLEEKIAEHEEVLAADQARVDAGFSACKAIASACQAGGITDLDQLQSLIAEHRP